MRYGIILSLLLLVIALLVIQPDWYFKNPKYRVSDSINTKLLRLGEAAITSSDVPVAAVLLYDSVVIGAGYNTVRRDKHAGGHAEINAISDAMKAVGTDSFSRLSRDKLMMITTWEPCPMCAGAIVEYNIRHVVVIRSKSLKYWFGELKRLEQYEWNKQCTIADTLQDHLFRMHPLYNKEKMKNSF